MDKNHSHENRVDDVARKMARRLNVSPAAVRAELRKAQRKNGNGADRLPPYSDEAEKALLGAIMESPENALALCIEKVKTVEVFYDLRHQTIYESMVQMYNARENVDLITLQQKLKDKQILEEVGGIAFLMELTEIKMQLANIDRYLSIVIGKFLLRRMVRACTEVVSRIYDDEGNPLQAMDEAERDIMAVRKMLPSNGTPPIQQIVQGAITRIEQYVNNAGAPMGLTTGFLDFDRLTQGLQNGDMIVFAGRPSLGKTSLAMNIVEHVAINCRIPVGVFSLEMLAQPLILRMICSRARVNLRNIQDGFVAERDFPKLTMAASKISAAPIHIEESRENTLMQIRAKARRMKQEFDIGLAVIDYLQLIQSANKDGRRFENRQQEMTDISAGIKSLALELGIPVIVLSQLNRELEREKHRRPRMSDLRESGAIEQDADLIGILYKPPRRNEDDEDYSEDRTAMPVKMMIGKQRNGPSDIDIDLTFLKTFTRYESAAKISDDAQTDMNYGKR